MRVWLELHVDDVLLAKHPGRWPEAAACVHSACRAAESEGAALSVRVRSAFAEGDRAGFLRSLVGRGHEVGAHAHDRDLARSVAALARAGVTSPVMAPGLVQAGMRGRLPLLARAWRLGARVVTDRVEAPTHPYAGWIPWSPLVGLIQQDVSVSPFAWGVVRRRFGRVLPACGELDWEAVGARAATQSAWRTERGLDTFFGATFHEHDLCPPGRLEPTPPMIDGLRRFCARFRPTRSADGCRLPGLGEQHNDRPVPAQIRPNPRSQAPIPERPRTLRLGPADARAAIVVVHAGESGLVERLRFLGLPDDAFSGCALWIYERTPGAWRAPGNPVHVADARRVIAAALSEGRPTIVLSWSGGCVPAAQAMAQLRGADPGLFARLAAFVDVEGPVDRFSLPSPDHRAAEWASFDRHDDAAWRARELVSLLPALAPLPYLRVQGSPDHVHGACDLHARRAVAAAAHAGSPASLFEVAGPLARHGERVVAAVLARLAQAGEAPCE